MRSRSKMLVTFGKHQRRPCTPVGALLHHHPPPPPPKLNVQRSAAHHRIQLCCCPLISNSTRETHAGMQAIVRTFAFPGCYISSVIRPQSGTCLWSQGGVGPSSCFQSHKKGTWKSFCCNCQMSIMTNFASIVLDFFRVILLIFLSMFSLQTILETDVFFHFDLSSMNNISLVLTEGHLATSD